MIGLNPQRIAVLLFGYLGLVTADCSQLNGQENTAPTATVERADGDHLALAAGADPVRPNPASRADAVPAERLRNAGIRIIEGKHLRLVTDLASEEAIDQLPGVFDLAVAQWANYFGVAEDQWSPWRMTGYLMSDPERFRIIGLYPEDEMPKFRTGYTIGQEFWMFQQEGDYYRRHLMLHEGVHGFMFTFFPSPGTPWHLEGMAELLATHKLSEEGLTVAYYPKDKTEVPLLGRIRIVKNELAAGRTLTLPSVLSYGARAHQTNAPYGWCWAAAAFLDGHPSYRDRFRQLNRRRIGDDFNAEFRRAFAADWRELGEEWLVFISGIQHAHDFQRSAIAYRQSTALPEKGGQFSVTCNRGWQNSGWQLEAGTTYEIRATGRYQVARDEQKRVWWCEPGGVTIRYVQNRPLGMLLGAVRPDKASKNTVSPLIAPQPIGLGVRFKPRETGALYFRVNESAADLSDNLGQLNVVIQEVRDRDDSGKQQP